VESVFFMVRSSSVFLLFALIYRKECARLGAGEKIICNSLIRKEKRRRGGIAASQSGTLGKSLF
jgi:hypothetical protein